MKGNEMKLVLLVAFCAVLYHNTELKRKRHIAAFFAFKDAIHGVYTRSTK